jgi:hypothetical protein
VGGSLQQLVPVLEREVRGQHGDGGQVETAIRQHRQEHGVFPGCTGHRNAEIGLGLGKVQDLPDVTEHRGKCLAGIEPSLLHLGDVGDDVRLDSTGLAHERGQALEQFVVRDRLERSLVFHSPNIGLTFSTSWDRAGAPQRG